MGQHLGLVGNDCRHAGEGDLQRAVGAGRLILGADAVQALGGLVPLALHIVHKGDHHARLIRVVDRPYQAEFEGAVIGGEVPLGVHPLLNLLGQEGVLKANFCPGVLLDPAGELIKELGHRLHGLLGLFTRLPLGGGLLGPALELGGYRPQKAGQPVDLEQRGEEAVFALQALDQCLDLGRWDVKQGLGLKRFQVDPAHHILDAVGTVG